jgi:preprotein translocase subunit SecA
MRVGALVGPREDLDDLHVGAHDTGQSGLRDQQRTRGDERSGAEHGAQSSRSPAHLVEIAGTGHTVIGWTLKKIFGTKNAREIRRMRPIVARINELEPSIRALSDAQLRDKTAEFRRRIDQGATIADLLPEAFAVVREGAWRAIGQRHYDVQLIGGMVLNRGCIAEMKTGEGKTLVATLPAYLNALPGKGVHIVTVNDYLARRDAEWMGKIFKFLGMSVGVIVHGLTDRERQRSYRCDVTYGQNAEFGFDYLRDNMKPTIERYVQRDLNFAIVDEVDSILIDEARTPLIISGPAEQSADLYVRVNQMIPSLKKDVDFSVDEKANSVMLTDAGVERVEKKLNLANLYDPANIEWLHHVTQALRAHTLYKRDVNYVVEDGKIIIIDEFTGRKMPGRRWSDGLHQAIEAKENVEIEEENQTLATISYQNYFRMYQKLSGMTGTAETEAEEFHKIYKLEVAVVPTNRPMVRKDYDDVIWKSEKGKFKHILDEIEEVQKTGRPILVGTISVEKSEVLSQMLRRRGIRHSVLNAKQHQLEALIVAQAGRPGAVTISTNMAGRGTDILLGGNADYLARQEAGAEPDLYEIGLDAEQRKARLQEHAAWKTAYDATLAKVREECAREHDEVVRAGGLHILGTERHEARRIDNQLRGRAGRQGDPGSSRFHLSLEDDLMRIFGAERITGLMERLGMEEDTPIEHGLVNRSIASAQQRVEGHNFDIRKHLLEYDDVMNQQRKAIYAQRRQVLEGRYVPEQPAASREAGEPPPQAPTESGGLTVETLGGRIRPLIARIADAHAQQVAAADAQAEPGTFRVQPAVLRTEYYRAFGAVVDLERVRSREECIAKVTREVAASLIQQRERLLDLCDEVIAGRIQEFCPDNIHPEEWDTDALREAVSNDLNFRCDLRGLKSIERDYLAEKIWEQVEKVVEAKETEMGATALLYFCRHFMLEEIDTQWIDHLRAMDQLREGIGLRSYGQRDPKLEYKKEGFNLFTAMLARIQQNVTTKLMRVHVERPAAEGDGDATVPAEFKHKQRRMVMGPAAAAGAGAAAADPAKKTVVRDAPRVGRNDPCPCGSGKKYKKCHLDKDLPEA